MINCDKMKDDIRPAYGHINQITGAREKACNLIFQDKEGRDCIKQRLLNNFHYLGFILS
jgi:hypothetical protein